VHCEWKRRRAILPVLHQLGIIENVSGFDTPEQTAPPPPIKLPRDFVTLVRVRDDLDRIAKKYLLDRGVTDKQIRENRIGVSYSGRYAYRIVFPVYVKKALKGIVARDFTGYRQPKYLNSPGEKFLYRFDPTAEACVLSEGVLKALRIQQVFSGNSAALLGHDLTSNQMHQIRDSRCKQIILYPDTDLVGRRGVITVAEKLIETWKGEVKVVCNVTVPADEDPLNSLAEHIKNALPYSWGTRQRLLLLK